MAKKETQPMEKDTRLSDLEGRVNEISRFLNELAARRNSQLQFPIDFRNRRVINRDLPVIKSIDDTGLIYTVEINDREHEWDFTPGGGGGAKAVTLIVGPAANADSADYDYTTDGTDDDVQIQAAHDALPANGGTILLREGDYTLGATVVITKDNTRLVGVGWATQITCENSLNLSMFQVGSNAGAGTYPLGIVFENIYFDGNKSNQTSCAVIEADTAGPSGWMAVRSCYFYNVKDQAVSVPAGGIISGCVFDSIDGNASGYAVALDGNSNDNDSFFVNNRMDNIAVGCAFLDTGDTVIESNYFRIRDGQNDRIIDGVGSRVIGNYMENANVSVAVGSSFRAIFNCSLALGNYISAGGTPDVASRGISNTAIVVGNFISGVGVAVYDCAQVSNNEVSDVEAHGIHVTDSNSIVTDNLVLNSGQATDNTYDGIFVDTAVDRCIITGNRVRNTTTTDNRYCINISAATCDNNIVSNNILTDAQTAQFNDAGTGTVTDGSNVTT